MWLFIGATLVVASLVLWFAFTRPASRVAPRPRTVPDVNNQAIRQAIALRERDARRQGRRRVTSGGGGGDGGGYDGGGGGGDGGG